MTDSIRKETDREYELIGLDLDGTLLDSQKRISEATAAALKRAVKSGKKVVLATGRAISELRPYVKELQLIEYGVCENGGLLYDFKNEKIINRTVFDRYVIQDILTVIKETDVMVQAMSGGRTYISERDFLRCDQYYLEEYRDLLQTTSEQVPDMYEFIRRHGTECEKVVLVHRSKGEREATRKKLNSLAIEMADSDITSLELTPKNVGKGAGFTELCRFLHIPLEKTIVVGDGENDRSFLECAGLSVAVANAEEAIKKICDVIVADNDHNGCQETIDRFLLKLI